MRQEEPCEALKDDGEACDAPGWQDYPADHPLCAEHRAMKDSGAVVRLWCVGRGLYGHVRTPEQREREAQRCSEQRAKILRENQAASRERRVFELLTTPGYFGVHPPPAPKLNRRAKVLAVYWEARRRLRTAWVALRGLDI